ncbi:MAG TPA: hypothetical protein EYH22_00280 [Candidatus Nanopusillus sp.]|nr:hypothetical protein [Candidatus Nanopusillus sp.]
MEIKIEILRPVNPAGISFIRYVYGAVAARNRKIIENYKREFTKLTTRFGYRIEEVIGSGKMITGKIVLETEEDGKPIKIYSKEIEIWEPIKKVNEKIEVTL